MQSRWLAQLLPHLLRADVAIGPIGLGPIAVRKQEVANVGSGRRKVDVVR